MEWKEIKGIYTYHRNNDKLLYHRLQTELPGEPDRIYLLGEIVSRVDTGNVTLYGAVGFIIDVPESQVMTVEKAKELIHSSLANIIGRVSTFLDGLQGQEGVLNG